MESQTQAPQPWGLQLKLTLAKGINSALLGLGYPRSLRILVKLAVGLAAALALECMSMEAKLA